jgi:hypothetical protein
MKQSILVSVLLTLAWFACSKNASRIAGGATDSPNASVTACVIRADGTPAAGSTVILRRSDYVTQPPASLAKSTIYGADALTDAQGHFEINGIDQGAYTIEVSDSSTGSRRGGAVLLTCSVDISDTINLGTDTLRPYGSVKGSADTTGTSGKRLFVQVVGIEQLALVDSTGAFTINNLPAGLFSLHIIAVEGSITTLVSTDQVSVIAGNTVATTMPGWGFSKRLFLNTTASGANVSNDVYGFPLLVRLNSLNFDFAQAHDSGQDTRFSKKDGSALPYEIERWDPANSQAEIWVKIDTVYGNDSSHYFIMYWGASAGPASNSAAVFDTANGFQGVWHLCQSAKDATINHYDGTLSDTAPVPAPGMIGMAYAFDGISNSIAMNGTANSTMNFPQDGHYSLSAWVSADTLGSSGMPGTSDKSDMTIVSKDNCQYALKTRAANWAFFEYEDKTGWQSSFAPAIEKAWKYVVGVRDGNRQYLYVDGICITDSVNMLSVFTDPRSTAADVAIGKMPGKVYPSILTEGSGYYFNGKIDEVRISSLPLTANWIKLCFMNQKSSDALIVFK